MGDVRWVFDHNLHERDPRRVTAERVTEVVTFHYHHTQMRAKDAEIAGLKRRIDQLESREIDVVVLQGDIKDLTHANARLREALKKYGRHGTVEHVCAMMKHSDYHCDCGFAQHALADTEGQKGA